MDRNEQIIHAIDQFFATHDAWAADPNSPQPTADYWRSEELLENVWDDGAIPLEFRAEIGSAINVLRSERIQLDESGELVVPQSFYDAVTRLKEARNPNTLDDHFHIEPFHEVAKLPGMGDRQLAMMYALVGRSWPKIVPGDDIPRIDLVQKEKAKPGSVIDENWVHPEQRRLELERMEREKRLNAVKFATSQATKPYNQFAESKSPETLVDLWALGQNGGTGVSTRQASLMTGKSEDEVKRAWKLYDQQKAKGLEIGDDTEPATEQNEQVVSAPLGEIARSMKESAKIIYEATIPHDDGDDAHLNGMDDKQLKTIAKQLGIGVGARSNRDKLIAKIKAARVLV